MSAFSNIYRFAVAIKGGSAPFRKRRVPSSKRFPDEAVLTFRRKYEATPLGGKAAVIRECAKQYGLTEFYVWMVATYGARSSPSKPLDPSLCD